MRRALPEQKSGYPTQQRSSLSIFPCPINDSFAPMPSEPPTNPPISSPIVMATLADFYRLRGLRENRRNDPGVTPGKEGPRHCLFRFMGIGDVTNQACKFDWRGL